MKLQYKEDQRERRKEREREEKSFMMEEKRTEKRKYQEEYRLMNGRKECIHSIHVQDTQIVLSLLSLSSFSLLSLSSFSLLSLSSFSLFSHSLLSLSSLTLFLCFFRTHTILVLKNSSLGRRKKEDKNSTT